MHSCVSWAKNPDMLVFTAGLGGSFASGQQRQPGGGYGGAADAESLLHAPWEVCLQPGKTLAHRRTHAGKIVVHDELCCPRLQHGRQAFCPPNASNVPRHAKLITQVGFVIDTLTAVVQ